MLVYIYDESGAPIGLQYRTSAYGVEEFDSFFFEKNLQGDIVAIYNENGVKIGQYQYDAWGNHSGKTLTTNTLERKIVYNYNPFRYCGYYYDLETGFYYLQSRYYNPEWGRFLNPDSIMAGTSGTLHGHNLYAYCFNNPIMMDDSDGNWPKWMKKAAQVVKKKVAKAAQDVKKFAKAVYNSIEFEAGLGFGYGASAEVLGHDVEATVYADVLTVSFDDGRMSDLQNVGHGAVVVGEDLFTYDYSHSYDYHGPNACDEHTMWSLPWDVATCEHAKASISYPGKKEDYVLGVSGSAHCHVGGHIKIGINISQFKREMGWD